uniref:CUB domain-containing protein n=1 Tax=Panagrolaimus davidi TaxID=227884 RepID=A0A914QDQ0_9BILA
MVNGSTELNCNSIFLAANENDYLWFAFINGAIMEFIINDNVTIAGPVLDFESNYDVQTYVSTTGIMIFQFMNQLMQNQPWTAFDAIVLPFSPSSVSDCPFSGQSITMNSDTIIPISSDFGIYTNASKNCSIGLNVSLYDPQVLYLKGSELNIMLYNIYNIYDQNGFFGIISIVPINANHFEGCQYTSNDNGSMSISNLDYINGYNAFTVC